MLSLILSIILGFFSIKSFDKGKYGKMLFLLNLLAFDFMGFGKLLGESSVKITDIGIIAICYIIYRSYSKDSHLFYIKEDNLGKIILYIFLYISVVFIGTIFFKQDSATYAFKVYRVYLALLFYFVLRKISIEEYEKYFKYMIYASILQGIFYYLQFVGLKGVLSGYGADSIETDVRLGNYPFLADVLFLYFLFKKNLSISKKIILLVFFGMMPVLGQMRGQILCMVFAIAIYCFIYHNLKQFIYLILGGIVWITVVTPMFSVRDKESSMSTNEELTLFVNHPLDMYKFFTNKDYHGSFIFRMAMLSERVDFIISHPEYALTGVGCVHEESPKNTYVMRLGTILSGDVDEGSEKKVAYLASADSTWVGVVMRFGIIGMILLLSYYILIIKIAVPKVSATNNLLIIVYGCYAIPALIGSFNGCSFDRLSGVLIICSTSALFTIYDKLNIKKLNG